ncbi:MAG TPA: tetraacyldisaccharide 4'-kinase [Gammaproteobacteria bacterium]|nr:tetraacyldisaccharide 4'-kinase [Gammaproteobacteria bacterium]
MKRLDHYWYSINFISLLLLPLSGVFCLLAHLRLLLYKIKFLKSYKAPVPVIVIGNISVGGTGKTPLIIELVKQLQSKGKTPGVISRGYGGKSNAWPQLVSAQTTAQQVGDEPQLIFQRCQCAVAVGPNRQQSIALLLSRSNCDIILSDDGLQHYALQREIEIVVVDAQRRFGNRFCLPAGPLREPCSRLETVDLVLFNGGNKQQMSFAMEAVQCNVVGRGVTEKEIVGRVLSSFSGQTVHAVAGIGHPQRFFNMLKCHDIAVIEHAFSDHHTYCESDLNFNDDFSVLMTEKDAVKCRDFLLSDHWAVAIEIVISAPAQQQLTQILNSLA